MVAQQRGRAGERGTGLGVFTGRGREERMAAMEWVRRRRERGGGGAPLGLAEQRQGGASHGKRGRGEKEKKREGLLN